MTETASRDEKVADARKRALRHGGTSPYLSSAVLDATNCYEELATQLDTERRESARLSNICQAVATLTYRAEMAGAESVSVADLNAALARRVCLGDAV